MAMNRDDPYTAQPLARWFQPAAIATVIWMALGCALYLFEVTLDPATLPADQRAVREAAPDWMISFYAIAVWVGLGGAILLLMRRKAAEPLLLGSLVAVMVQFSAYFLDRELRQAVPADGMLIPIVVVVLSWTIYWFARHSRRREWLR